MLPTKKIPSYQHINHIIETHQSYLSDEIKETRKGRVQIFAYNTSERTFGELEYKSS